MSPDSWETCCKYQIKPNLFSIRFSQNESKSLTFRHKSFKLLSIYKLFTGILCRISWLTVSALQDQDLLTLIYGGWKVEGWKVIIRVDSWVWKQFNVLIFLCSLYQTWIKTWITKSAEQLFIFNTLRTMLGKVKTILILRAPFNKPNWMLNTGWKVYLELQL